MKVIFSFIFLANLWFSVLAENYMWGKLQFGSNIYNVCSEDDIEKLDAAIPEAIDCVGEMMGNIEFTLDSPPEDGERRLTNCGYTCSTSCTTCRFFCRGWSCTRRRLGAPELFQPEERHLSCTPDMNWQEDQAVEVFNGVCYNDAVNKAGMSHSCRAFLFDNTDKTFYAQIN